MPISDGRRTFIQSGLLATLISVIIGGYGSRAYAGSHIEGAKKRTRQEWMDALVSKGVETGTLRIGRFRDHYYYLTDSIGWRPSPKDDPALPAVNVPKGFVTDLTSVPQPFWSFLPPDGDYVYAAVLHDYLYWMQTSTREQADNILKIAMQDFDIPAADVTAIYGGVRLGGGSPWKKNAALKGKGELRVLSRFPEDPRMTWQEWKKGDVFVKSPDAS